MTFPTVIFAQPYLNISNIALFFSFVLGNMDWGSKPPKYVDSLGSIAWAYAMKMVAGEDGIE